MMCLHQSNEQDLHCVPSPRAEALSFSLFSFQATCPWQTLPPSQHSFCVQLFVVTPQAARTNWPELQLKWRLFASLDKETWRNHTIHLRKAKTGSDYIIPDYHWLRTVFLAQMLSKTSDILPRFHPVQEGGKKIEESEGVLRVLLEFIIFCDFI